MQSKLTTFTVAEHELTLRVEGDVFEPNKTTDKIAQVVEIPPGSTVLDLGCGVGPLAIMAALRGAKQVFAVDVVERAVELARENVERAGVADRVTVLSGDLFEPVGDRKFDVIVNDVSGIADRVARLSPWYPASVPTGGEDGTGVVTRAISEAPDHLNPDGVFYFATSSLSDVDRILRHARQVFGDTIEPLGTHRFPFCPELVDAVDEMARLQEEGKISFEARRSRYIWTLEVFKAQVQPTGASRAPASQ